MTVVTPGSAGPSPQGQAHQPQSTAAADPRFPWKAKGTRKPLPFWDRSKFLMLFAAIFGVLVWYDMQRFSPPATFAEIISAVAWDQQWVLWLAGVEVLRQLHFAASEHSGGYHRFWNERVFGRATRAYERRFNPWNRFRIARVLKWIFLIALVAVLLGQFTSSSPVVALFKVPAMVVQALPLVAQITLILMLSVGQMAAIFWFMARGGVDTYFPDDIETRFSDVWGQDHVLERIKENIVLLENPESIEAKGGHVPSGILLYGPPGTGKTLIAEAVAGETGKPYVFVDPGAFQNMFFGVGILKVKGLFRKLRKLAVRYGGVIVFFDEADSLGSRGGAISSRSPAPFAGETCNGLSHVSRSTRHVVAQHAALHADALDPGRPLIDRVVGVPMNGMGGGGGMGTLQALLTELSGLKKPRGFVNRVIRKTLGMRPKPPPKYRILTIMATNLPDALDAALRRPGRIDREYRVGYPSKAGRLRTYEGYLAKVSHSLTPEQIDKLATITPYWTGARMKDLVNEALISAIREDRDSVTWRDVIKAKHLKDLGPSEDVDYVERERHATAVHEACHAVAAWRTRHHMQIDLATIEKRSNVLGMVSSVPPEDKYTDWRSEMENDVVVSLASLAGERMFFGGDSSDGVSSDLFSATIVTARMESYWGMGAGVASLPALQQLQIGMGTPEERRPIGAGTGGLGFGVPLKGRQRDVNGGSLPQRIETSLLTLLQRAEELLDENRAQVLALAHALETHKTLSGEDVIAVLEGTRGDLVDGRPYADPDFIAELEEYHRTALQAHEQHTPFGSPMPAVPGSAVETLDLDALFHGVAASNGQANGGQPNGHPGWQPYPAPAPAHLWARPAPAPAPQPVDAPAAQTAEPPGAEPADEAADQGDRKDDRKAPPD